MKFADLKVHQGFTLIAKSNVIYTKCYKFWWKSRQPKNCFSMNRGRPNWEWVDLDTEVFPLEKSK